MSATGLLVEKPRISSIDLVRGIVMVIMALDHTRDFLHGSTFNPTDLSQTYPFLFFTRWITHFCAPTFVLLSGTSIRISQQRKSLKELSLFLLTRGIWLIFLEVTVMRFSFFFNFYYDVIFLQVIWVIGACMIMMAALIHLPFKVIVTIAVVIAFGHNLLGMITLQPEDKFYLVWGAVIQPGFMVVSDKLSVLLMYPVLPWLGIMLMGYCLGSWYTKGFDREKRQTYLLRAGLLAIALFIVLRFINLYGDPAPWSTQKNFVFTLLSFLNCTKYPPSLLYTLMTLGPVLLLLGFLEKHEAKFLTPLIAFGRVPLFYYILHFYLIHTLAFVLYLYNYDKSISEMDFHFPATFGGIPQGVGYSLFWVYVAWFNIVVFLYPICTRYNDYKRNHNHWWLSYL